MKSKTPWLAPALAITAIILLIGCIPIPAFYKHADPGPRPDHLIGKRPSSDKPLAIGRSTRADVEALFGPPRYATPESAYVRRFTVVSLNTLVCGLYLEPNTEYRWLLVRFDRDGTIADFDVYSNFDKLARDLGSPLPRLATPDELEQMSRDRAR